MQKKVDSALSEGLGNKGHGLSILDVHGQEWQWLDPLLCAQLSICIFCGIIKVRSMRLICSNYDYVVSQFCCLPKVPSFEAHAELKKDGGVPLGIWDGLPPTAIYCRVWGAENWLKC